MKQSMTERADFPGCYALQGTTLGQRIMGRLRMMLLAGMPALCLLLPSLTTVGQAGLRTNDAPQDKKALAESLKSEADRISTTAQNTILRKAKVHPMANFTLVTLGAKEAADLRTAIAKYEKASLLFGQTDEQINQMICRAMIGHIYRVLGDTSNSVASLKQAADLADDFNVKGILPILLSEIGFAYDDGGHAAEALDYYKRAVFENVDYWKGNNGYLLGIIFRFTDLLATMSDTWAYTEVINVEDKIVSIARELKSTDETFAEVEMFALANLGKNYTELGSYYRAIESYQEASKINQKYKYSRLEQNLTNNIGIAYLRLGSLDEAEKYVKLALALGTQYKTQLAARRPKGAEWRTEWRRNLDLIAKWKANLGAVYARMKRYEAAVSHFEETLPQLKAMRARMTAAKEKLDEVNAASFIIVTSYYYGAVLREQRKFNKAFKLHEESIRIAQETSVPKFHARSLYELGLDYLAVGELEAAIKQFEQAFILSRRVGARDEEAASLDGLMQAWELHKNPKLAIFFGKQAVTLLQLTRVEIKPLGKETVADFVRDNENVYRRLAALLITQGRFNEALQIVNISRDQEFFDLNPGLDVLRSESEVALTPHETTSNLLLKKPWTQAEELESRLTQIEAEFDRPTSKEDKIESVPEMAGLNDEQCKPRQQRLVGNVADAEEIKYVLCKLEKDSSKKYAVIYTLVATDNFYTLLLTPSGTTAFSHPTRAVDANTMVDEFLNVLRTPASPDEVVQKHGSRLYNVIFKSTSIEDVQKTLQAVLEKYKPDVLLWSLDGKLRYIPVAALYEAEGQQYLVEKYQGAVFTRAKTERLLREPTLWTEGLGFGASKAPKVTCGSKRLSELLSVTGELLNIFSNESKEKGISFKGQFFLNGEFTRTSMVNNLKARKPPLVHISSHFCFQPGDARSSFLLLGDGKPFSLYEMQAVPNLFDGVETLTLSACETAALQPNATGKEIDSFAELAQRLRANSVIATLWGVDDGGSSELMTNFYRLYKEHQEWPKAELLRQAQLRLLKAGPNSRRSHPYYWAPFVLYGGFR